MMSYYATVGSPEVAQESVHKLHYAVVPVPCGRFVNW